MFLSQKSHVSLFVWTYECVGIDLLVVPRAGGLGARLVPDVGIDPEFEALAVSGDVVLKLFRPMGQGFIAVELAYT